MRTEFSQTSAREFTSDQFEMWDEVEMSPGLPNDTELKLSEPEKREFDLVNAVVHSEMSKMTQREKREVCATNCLPEDPRYWSVDQVVTWIGLMVKNCSIVDDFTATIRKYKINGEQLCSTTETEFKAIFPNDDVIFQCLEYWKVPMSSYTESMMSEQHSYGCDVDGDMKEIIRQAMEDPGADCDLPTSPSDSGYASDCYHATDCHASASPTKPYAGQLGAGLYEMKTPVNSYAMMSDVWTRAPNPMIGGHSITPPNTPMAMDTGVDYPYGGPMHVDYIKTEPGMGYCSGNGMSYAQAAPAPDYQQSDWSTSPNANTTCPPPISVMKGRRKGPGRPPKPESEKKRKKVGRGQPLLWEYILRCLDNKLSGEMLTWVDRNNGIFKFFSGGKELFAKSWGSTKGNRKVMTYQKMARALRDYGKKNIIIKYKKKLHYKFISEKTLTFLNTTPSTGAALASSMISPLFSEIPMTSSHADGETS